MFSSGILVKFWIQGRAVDQNIQFPELLDRYGHHGINGPGVAYIRLLRDAAGVEIRQFLGNLLGFANIEIGDQNSCAGFGQSSAKLATQQTCAASNDSDATSQVKG
jgi:hypothetical protein